MPSVEELLDQAETYTETGQAKEDNVYCVIDPETRTIDVPEQYSLLGVESDEKVERIWFQCSKIVGDNIDLSKLQIRVNYQNANNETDQYIVTDVQTDGDNIIFSWLLSRKVTAYRGSVSFIVCAVRVSGETIQNEWNTTLATAQVLQGLEVDDPEITEEESDVIAQLLQIMTDTSEQAVSDVNVAKTNAISAITAQQVESVSAVQSAQSTAVQAVENAGELIKESLPSDYTELSNKVDELDRTKAPAITESTSGESIQLSDSGDAPLTDIKLYGKSKQDGEPSPDNPVEIEIPGSEGNVGIESVGANLYDLDSVGTYYDNFQSLNAKNGQSLYIMIETTSGTSQMNYRFSFVDGTKGGDENIVSPSESNGVNKKVITLNKDITGIGFYSVDMDNIRTVSKVMVAISDTELTYEPYKHTSATLPTPNGLPGIPVTSGGNYTDADGQQWVCDEIDFKRGKYVQRVKERIYGENENVNVSGYDAVYTIKQKDVDYSTPALSNMFIYIDRTANGMDFVSLSDYSDSIVFGLSWITGKDTEAAKNWFAQKYAEGNPVKVLYVLATPIETDLTTEQLTALKQLRTYQTVTNITTDSEPQVGMEVEYTADTKTWIENKFTELAQSLAATQNTWEPGAVGVDERYWKEITKEEAEAIVKARNEESNVTE